MFHAPKLSPSDIRRLPALASRSLQNARHSIGHPHLPQLPQLPQLMRRAQASSPAPVLLDSRVEVSSRYRRDWEISAHHRPADVLGSIHTDGTDFEVQFLGFPPEPYRFDSFDAGLDYFTEFVSALDLGHTDHPAR